MLHRRTVTADKLARAIRAALGSQQMREKARQFAESMQREDGIKRAIELINERRW
jgi:UDP:flavonoid glycosyltransferase YjiC (YdhE family)